MIGKRIDTVKMRVTAAEKSKLRAYKRIYGYPSLTRLIMDWMINQGPRFYKKKKGEAAKGNPSQKKT